MAAISFGNLNCHNRIDEYRMPSIIQFGCGASSKIGELARGIAGKKSALIVTDETLSRLGLLTAIEASLREAGFKTECLAQSSVEPTVEQCIDTAKHVARGKFGLLIGFGGGSCLDRTKIASCFSAQPDKLEEQLAPAALSVPAETIVPKILIPTTSGTGSEVSNTAVTITKQQDIGRTKSWITGNAVLADAVIIDPDYMANLPPRITASSGLDALSHCAEGVLSKQANAFSDALGIQGVRLAAGSLRTAYQQGGEIPAARWNMAMAAMLGGLVISYGWVSGPATLGHVVSEGISSWLDMSHGDACGVLLPYIYWYNLQSDYARDKLVLIADAMGENIHGSTTLEAAKMAILATFRLLEDLDVPTSLKEYGMKRKDIPRLSKYILKRSEEMYLMSKFNPRQATLENLMHFFNIAYEGRSAVEDCFSSC
jgi:alcohol dehydrogenase class IV